MFGEFSRPAHARRVPRTGVVSGEPPRRGYRLDALEPAHGLLMLDDRRAAGDSHSFVNAIFEPCPSAVAS
jgi:hypothetical protein